MSNTAGVRLITLDEVIDRVPYSKVHIYRLMERGSFPRAVPIGAQRVAWVEKEIEDWIATRVHDRDYSFENKEAIARKALAQLAAKTRHAKSA